MMRRRLLRLLRPRWFPLLILAIALPWLASHLLMAGYPPSPHRMHMVTEDEPTVNPNVVRTLQLRKIKQESKWPPPKEAKAATNPELEDLFDLKWPAQGTGQEPVWLSPQNLTMDRLPVNQRKLFVSGEGHPRSSMPIAGTNSIVRINTTGKEQHPAPLKLLQTLMFRIRPEDSVYNINASLSDRTSLDRELPDSRQRSCKKRTYDTRHMPSVSVIIPFYNEPLSMVLRTVHSIINRTPPHLLEEVILVDDASDNLDLGVPLEKYVTLMSKVILIRNTVRLGLIRTRQLGANLARGRVLVFQDGHTECNVGWLEPLLEQIVKDRRTIVQPVIDNIHSSNLYYEGARVGAVPRSSFTWDLRLVWTRIPRHENARRLGPAEPFRAPVLVGCAIAVDKSFFLEIGGFDPEMNIWGGENFEVPFRTWLCGGQVLTVPCSRVGHTFRKLPYLLGETPTQIERNLLRTAELWMGDHKRWVYGSISERYYLNETDLKSIAQRKQELSHLNCKSFDWYLRNIIPEVPLPPEGVALFGEIGNFQWSACLALVQDDSIDLTSMCFQARMLPENFFYIDPLGRLVYARTGACVKMDTETRLLYVISCGDIPPGPSDGQWNFRRSLPKRAGQLVLSFSDEFELCLTQTSAVVPMAGRHVVRMKTCEPDWPAQIWLWTYDFNLKRVDEHREL